MRILPDLSQNPLYQAYESYNNPRLENDGAEFLTAEHIAELKRESEIVLWDEYAKPKVAPGVGTLRRIGIRTAQGYTYDTLVGIPEQPECAIPVIGTSAWTTSLRGHNEHVVRNLVRAGNYVLFVGSEGRYGAYQKVKAASPISLANSAATVLNFSYHMIAELRSAGHDVDEEKRFVVGESRGGMVGEGIDALAEEFAQDVLFSDQVAPCLPERLQSITDIVRLTEQIAKEPGEMAKLLGSLTLSRLRYYPHTIDIRLDCLKHQAAIGGALFSGETGHLSLRTPGTTLKHLTVFDNDFASNRSWWETRYMDNPLVRTTPLPGGHMTIADLETLRYVLARNKTAQQFINSGSELTANVFDLSHELALRQFPITAAVMNSYPKTA